MDLIQITFFMEHFKEEMLYGIHFGKCWGNVREGQINGMYVMPSETTER